MLLNVNGGIIWARFAWLLAQLLLNPFGQVRVDVLSKMVFPVEAFATLTASVNLVSAMYNRVPLQVFLTLKSLVADWARMRSLCHMR